MALRVRYEGSCYLTYIDDARSNTTQVNKQAFIGIVYEKENNRPYRDLSRGQFSSYPRRYTNCATSVPSLAAMSKNNIKEDNIDPT